MYEFDYDNFDYDVMFKSVIMEFEHLWNDELVQAKAAALNEENVYLEDNLVLCPFELIVRAEISLDNLDDWHDLYGVDTRELEEILELLRDQTHTLFYIAVQHIKLVFNKNQLNKILKENKDIIYLTDDLLTDLITCSTESKISGNNDENDRIRLQLDPKIVRYINNCIGWPLFKKDFLIGSKIKFGAIKDYEY